MVVNYTESIIKVKNQSRRRKRDFSKLLLKIKTLKKKKKTGRTKRKN